MRPTLILLHGWGFDLHLWDKLGGALVDYSIICWDRGYFGKPRDRAVDRPVAGIGHSLGSMLLAKLLPPEAPLIAINGFDHFTGADGVPARVVERMKARFVQAPAEVLSDFRMRCGARPAVDALNEKRLAADLALLANDRAVSTQRPILSLQGKADLILPESLRDTVFPGATRATQDEAGHLLPVTHAAWCAERIHAFLCR